MYEFNNKLYDNLEGFDFFNVDGVKFAWNPKWRNVGINLSGGADSACLAYTIAKYIKENKPFTLKNKMRYMAIIIAEDESKRCSNLYTEKKSNL